MTFPATRIGIDLARPGSDRPAASVWWRGRPLEVEARHFVTATAEVSGFAVEALLGRNLRLELRRWRRRGKTAAARCHHLPTAGVARAFGCSEASVSTSLAITRALIASDPEEAQVIVEIQGWAMAHAISDLSGFKR